MILEIGTCVSEKNSLSKNYTLNYSLTGNIKEPSSVIDPVILIQADLSMLAGCNYCYIPVFRRFYYITNMKTATNETCTLSLHVDVLQSFNEEIKACSGYVDRNEDIVSPMIADAERQRQINPAISTVPFSVPTEGSGYTYCLITTRAVP